MFARIRSKFARRPSLADDRTALRIAGYHDVPDRIDARHRADRERLNLPSIGHLR